MHADLLHLQQWLAPTHRDREAHRFILKKLELVVKTKYPNATLSIVPCSPPEIDMFFNDVNMRVSLPSSSQRGFGPWLKEALHASRWAHRVETFFSSNKPYLTFLDRDTAIPIEVSFDDFWTPVSPLEAAYRLPEFAPVLCAVKIMLAQKGVCKSFSSAGHVQVGAVLAEYLLRARPINPPDFGANLRNFARWLVLDFNPEPHRITIDRSTVAFGGFKKVIELRAFLEQAMAADASLGTAIQRGDMRLACWLDLQNLTKARMIKARLIEAALPSKGPAPSASEFADEDE